jgi:hypothetical protein
LDDRYEWKKIDEIMEIRNVVLKVPLINMYMNFYVYKYEEKRDQFQMNKLKMSVICFTYCAIIETSIIDSPRTEDRCNLR